MKDDEAKSFSRRSFLKGAAGTAALTAIPTAVRALEPPAEAEPPAAIPVRVRVNGTWQNVRVNCRTTLGRMLREDLGLTGTKLSCEMGECGSCTVIVDGRSVNACLMLAAETDGAEVTTIEGLANGDRLHPVQQAFVDADGMQCGFCTPGQVMACKALLDRVPRPDDETIRHGMSGNLCRCGAYANILEAVRIASGRGGERQ
jgi:xanthine dehydrogenase YagT iron-sulfur-binding subunit